VEGSPNIAKYQELVKKKAFDYVDKPISGFSPGLGKEYTFYSKVGSTAILP
jgi:hypothetical protein